MAAIGRAYVALLLLFFVLSSCCLTNQRPADTINATKYATNATQPLKTEPVKATTISTSRKPTTTAATIRAVTTTNRVEVSSTIPGKAASTASILDYPIRDDFGCFYTYNIKTHPECSRYYDKGYTVCPKYYNPVCGKDGFTYPSACWAEKLGTSVESYGLCGSLKRFISDMWLTKKLDGKSFVVPSPDIEFTYSGSGLVGWKSGVWLRSTLWKSSTAYYLMDYNILVNQETNKSTRTSYNTLSLPVINDRPKVLLAFVTFDDAYPENVLMDWAKTYTNPLNDYFRKKQRVSRPIQYDITPLVIPPPKGVERISTKHIEFSFEEIQKMYEAATAKAGSQDSQIFIVSPVIIKGFGGYTHPWDEKVFIDAPLTPPAPYSSTDKKAGLDGLAAFQEMFSTIHHELLHTVGLQGDHMPMDVYYLETIGKDVDPVTGKERAGPSDCDFLGTSPDYYPMELPADLKIRAGQEPTWLSKEKSSTGDCLFGLYNSVSLKDYDRDGVYEIMYKNNMVNPELQRSLGWVDVDGDNVSEIEDTDAYGGWKSMQYDTSSDPVWGYDPSMLAPFEPLGEADIGDCRFEKIRLANGQEGLAPLKCAEFDSDVVNLYKKVQYYWKPVKKAYGTVLLARLG